MKLASLKAGGRDGTLVVVKGDLTRYQAVTDIAPTLQAALENWPQAAPELAEISEQLNAGQARHAQPFHAAQCASPLPRAYQWLDGSAYLAHVEKVRRARNSTVPESFYTDPLMYQGHADATYGPRDAIRVQSEDWGIDMESEIAVITGFVPMGATAEQSAPAIRLLMLVNDLSFRNLIPNELAKGFGFVNGKGQNAFSPVAVTPDELGDAWRDGRVHLPLLTHWNGKPFGKPNAGVDMTFNFPQLVAHGAKTRELQAGTIVGSGTVANHDETVGYSCIAEARAVEQVRDGKISTQFMKFGDTVRIEMLDAAGRSIFGAIEQRVEAYQGSADQPIR